MRHCGELLQTASGDGARGIELQPTGTRESELRGYEGGGVRTATRRAAREGSIGRRNARLLGVGGEEMIRFRVWMVVVSYKPFILGQAVGQNYGLKV